MKKRIFTMIAAMIIAVITAATTILPVTTLAEPILAIGTGNLKNTTQLKKTKQKNKASTAKPDRPASISVYNFNGVCVTWSSSTNTTQYKLYYRKKGASKWKGVATTDMLSYTMPDELFTTTGDTGFKNGKTKFQFAVKAVNKNGSSKLRTTTAKITVAIGTGGIYSVQNTKKGFVITAFGGNLATHATLYRAEVFNDNSTGKWEKVKTVKLPKTYGTATFTVKDKKVKKGKTYNYFVKSARKGSVPTYGYGKPVKK